MGVLDETLRNKINEKLENIWEIEWWGHLDDLVSGDGDFAKGIRESFREGQDKESSLTIEPITANERKAFLNYLASWGS